MFGSNKVELILSWRSPVETALFPPSGTKSGGDHSNSRTHSSFEEYISTTLQRQSVRAPVDYREFLDSKQS